MGKHCFIPRSSLQSILTETLTSTLHLVTLSTIELSYLPFRILSKSNYLEGSICLSKLNFNTLVVGEVWTRKLIREGSAAGFPQFPII